MNEELPTILNIGSGKNYMPEALNIDINYIFKPDLVWDISQPLNLLGDPVIPFGHFDKIVAHDVLEHIRDLTAAMTNCLNLLKEGGVMDIVVPYDLSLGAWSDPTHVRAFNERSWMYYSEWAWYLGWRTHALILMSIELQCAEWADKSQPVDILYRTPRAIESMHVILKKVPYIPPEELRQ